MKAIVCRQYGSPDVLRLEEVEKPTAAGDRVLIRVRASSVNAGDWHILRADPFLVRLVYGLRRPKYPILGTDVAGVVEAVAGEVTQFKPGDEVFGDLSGCGFGGFAQYATAPQRLLAIKPANLTFEQAAAVPSAAVTALQALRDAGKITSGMRVLINGASGGVGTFAVQIAKSFDTHVTAVCGSRKLAGVRAIGADEVIDYTAEDFTQSDKRYDLILAANGNHPIGDYKRALSPGGTYVMSGGSTKQMFQALLLGPLMSLTGNKRMTSMLVKPNQADLQFVGKLLSSEKITPVIDRHYPLSQTPDAIRYLEQGHAAGKVVITIE